MSLERLVDEIRTRAEAEIGEERRRLAAEESRITEERDRRLATIQAEATRQAELETARERAQRLARAKLDARKRVFEARERKIGRLLEATRGVLTDFADSEEYPAVLKRLYAYAQGSLGKQIRVRGRAKDASLLRTIAKGAFSDEPLPILGGLVAETTDGARRLNLSFDELVRLREDRVRELLAA
ncbi:MAG TPA: V-type ATP synthase subunit E family protein [Thermoplasmata archaeon]|nr:V-type ATP synthase subunit E family protein [Thermoplasmata archaeon]